MALRLVDRLVASGSGSHTSAALDMGSNLYGVRLSCTSGEVTVDSVRLD